MFSIKKLILLANIHQIHHCHCRVKIYISQYYTDRFISDLVIGEKVLQKPTEINIFRKLKTDIDGQDNLPGPGEYRFVTFNDLLA